MARWTAIVALLLGMGFTAFQSFSAPAERGAPVTAMDGPTGFPPPDSMTDGPTGFPTPVPPPPEALFAR
jgi:hypothetical protein